MAEMEAVNLAQVILTMASLAEISLCDGAATVSTKHPEAVKEILDSIDQIQAQIVGRYNNRNRETKGE